MVQHVVDWLDERIDLSGIRYFIAEKGVPIHTQEVWYYLGGMTMFLFAVQVFTGILLLLYYRPSSAEAYESVQFIVTQVEFGWLIRNVHSWSANLLIALAFAHFFSVFFLKSYRKPRELTWLTGILLLFRWSLVMPDFQQSDAVRDRDRQRRDDVPVQAGVVTCVSAA
jgi:cytochrome b6